MAAATVCLMACFQHTELHSINVVHVCRILQVRWFGAILSNIHTCGVWICSTESDFLAICTVKWVKLDPRNSVEACPHHTVSRAWCYDHYVSKLTLCDLGLYHMYTNICVLMYLYYIYLLISAMMNYSQMKSRPYFTSDYDTGFWARLVIGLRTVWVAGCGMARTRSARWTLWPWTITMVSSGFTRSTCLLNCLMPELTKVH